MGGAPELAAAQLRGDRQRALDDVALARGVAERSDGVPTLLRCRLWECEFAESPWERTYLARTLAADATAVGMPAVVEAAESLARARTAEPPDRPLL